MARTSTRRPFASSRHPPSSVKRHAAGLPAPGVAVFCAVLLALPAQGVAAGPVEAGLSAAVSNRLAEGIAAFSDAYSRWDVERFLAADRVFGDILSRHPRLAAAAYWRGVTRFQVAAYYMGDDQPAASRALAAKWIGEAEESVEEAAALDRDNPENAALLSGLAGLRIRQSPARGIWLGSRVLRLREEALAGGSGNPRVRYLVGSGCFHGPTALGGKAKALEHFTRGAALYEEERRERRSPLAPAWGHSSCLAFIGRIYEDSGRVDDAARQYRLALDLEPLDKLATEGMRRLAGKRRTAADEGRGP